MAEKFPPHIAIIMDGNGRWAKRQQLVKHKGHQAGRDALKDVAEFLAKETPVQYLTVFAFAQTNYTREYEEQQSLFRILKMQASQTKDFLSYEARVRFVGNRVDHKTPKAVLSAMVGLEEATKNCEKLNLQIAWGYSGQDEILRAQKAGWDITRLYKTMYDAADVPPIDLMIRTGIDNEFGLVWRGSDFFPLLGAHAVDAPFECMWPDFTPEHLLHGVQKWRAEAHLCGGSRPD